MRKNLPRPLLVGFALSAMLAACSPSPSPSPTGSSASPLSTPSPPSNPSPTLVPTPTPSPLPTPPPTPAPTPTHVPLPPITQHTGSVIYFTFDDGPNPTWTPEILSLLEKYHVHASFFVVGQMASRWPAIVAREYKDGDAIGDHSTTHPDLTKLPLGAAKIQLQVCASQIKQITGHAPTLWRPPYEAFNRSVINLALALGMRMQLWSVSTGDWQLPGISVIVSRVESVARNNMVVLFHDAGGNTRAQTVAAVSILIPYLLARGYQLDALPPGGQN